MYCLTPEISHRCFRLSFKKTLPTTSRWGFAPHSHDLLGDAESRSRTPEKPADSLHVAWPPPSCVETLNTDMVSLMSSLPASLTFPAPAPPTYLMLTAELP